MALDFSFTAEQRDWRAHVRAFAERELKPHTRRWDESQTLPDTAAEPAVARSEPVQRSKAAASSAEDSEAEESDPADEDESAPAIATEKVPPRMPEKKPQFNLPRRSYGGGPSVKRRSVKR